MDSLDKAIAELQGASATPGTEVAPLVVRSAENFPITAGQLRALAQKHAGHPLSAHFIKAAGTFPSNKRLVVERPDLIAMIEDKEVDYSEKIETITVAGVSQTARVIRKRLVPRGQAKNPSPTPHDVLSTEPAGEPLPDSE